MIQLKQNNTSKDGYFNIYIGKNLVGDSWAFRTVSEPNSPFQYSAKNERACRDLASQTIEDFEPFSAISLNNIFSWMFRGHSIIISSDLDEDTNEEIIVIAFYFSPNLTFWNKKYSFAEYFDVFEENCAVKFEGNYEITFEEAPALRLELYFKKILFPIEEIIISIENEIQSIHENTVKILQNKYQVDLVQTVFDFPSELRFSCQQYLLYFAQFLRDLGVNATSNLKEESGKVLFSVTPTDDIEALDKIREALVVYLNLPSSSIVYDDSFAAMRLQQQIENLEHSQKMAVREIQLAEKVIMNKSETIREKNTIISQKDSTIEQQSKIIEKISSKSIMLDSVENKEELEEICDGLKIGEFRWLMEKAGIHFNLATFVRGIGKRILGKPDEISILESNDVKEENN